MEILKLNDESMLLNIFQIQTVVASHMGQELTSDLLEITLRSL